MPEHPDNGCAFSCLFPRRSDTHARIESTFALCEPFPRPTKDLSLKISEIPIERSIPQLSIHHVSTTIIYDNSPRFFPESSPFSPSPSHFGSLYLTPRTARPYLAPRWPHASACIRAHGGTFHLYTEGHTGTRARKYVYHIYMHRHRYTSGHATDGRTTRRNDDRQLNGGGVCTFRRLHATKEESVAAVATAAAHYIAWRTLVPVLALSRQRTDIPDSVNRLNRAPLQPRRGDRATR